MDLSGLGWTWIDMDGRGKGYMDIWIYGYIVGPGIWIPDLDFLVF